MRILVIDKAIKNSETLTKNTSDLNKKEQV
jgi:hypothetical protein